MKNCYINMLFFLSVIMLISCAKGGGTDGNKEEPTGQPFYPKKVLIMEFVSFDCVYCPQVTQILDEVALKKYPNRLNVISVHGRLEQQDPMEFPGYKQFQNHFYGITGYPAVITDQVDNSISIGTFDASSKIFLERLNASAQVGIALRATAIGDHSVRLDVEVANADQDRDDYQLAVAVVENDIKYKQADLVNGSLKWIENYSHFNVLRGFLTDNYFGDALGLLKKKEVYRKSFTYTVPASFKKENLSFVAYVINIKGFASSVAVNSQTVALGKSIDFEGKIN